MVHLPETLSDHPSLIGIIRLPKCNYKTNGVPIPLVVKKDDKFSSMRQRVEMATEITSVPQTSQTITIPKNEPADFFPYTYYVLTDGECEPLILYPQYMPTNSTFKGVFALSHQPIERYYLEGYKGDKTGNVYNITNINQMMLPTGTNEGISYMSANANTISQGRKSQITGNVLTAITTVASAFVNPSSLGYGASNVISGLMSIKETDARNKDTMLTPSTISSFGTPSTRSAFNNNNVRLLKYSVSDVVKNKIRSINKKYGNKYNNYATIDIKKYKGYIKFVDIDIDGKIDMIYINKIKEILERGVIIE